MKIKRFASISVAAMLFCSVPAFGAEAYVKLNGEAITFEDQKPEIINGRTLVPLRGVFDSMGFEVNWNAQNKSAEIKNRTFEITMTENINRIMVNGDSVEIDVAPQIINDRLMIPLRAVAESSQAQVDWDSETKTASIYYNYNVKQDVDESIDNMDISEQDYLHELIAIMEELKKTAEPFDDAILFDILYLGGHGNSADVSVPKEQFNVLNPYLDKLKALKAPETLSSVDACVKEYVSFVSEIIKYSQNHNYDPENIDFTETMESYKRQIQDINSRFGNELFKYFLDNKVYFEGIYGEYVLDILLS